MSAAKAHGGFSSTIAYGRQLVGSGIEGASTALRDAMRDDSANAVLERAVRLSWRLGVAAAGVAFAVSALRKRSPGAALLHGLAGGAIAFGAGMVWSSQGLTAAAARGAVARVNAARDAHWLEHNPIDYA